MRTLNIEFVKNKCNRIVNVDTIISINKYKDSNTLLIYLINRSCLVITYEDPETAMESYKSLVTFLHGTAKQKKLTVMEGEVLHEY